LWQWRSVHVSQGKYKHTVSLARLWYLIYSVKWVIIYQNLETDYNLSNRPWWQMTESIYIYRNRALFRGNVNGSDPIKMFKMT